MMPGVMPVLASGWSQAVSRPGGADPGRTSRISRPALLSTGLLHLALFWMVLQSPQVAHKVRAAVQYLAPITLHKQENTRPLTTPQPKLELKVVPEIKPPAARSIKPLAIELPPETPPDRPVEKAPDKPAEKAPEKPAERAMELKIQAVLTPPIQGMRDVALPQELPRVVKMPAPEIDPVVVAPVLPPPTFAPTPEQMPTATPLAATEPLPVVVPPAPAPEPKAMPTAQAAPVAPPSPPPAAPVLPNATPAPTQPSALMAAPGAVPLRPAAISQMEAAPAAATAPGRASAPAALPAAGPAGPVPRLYPYVMGNSGRQRSVAEMVNEQLNGNGSRNRLGEALTGAGKPDCIGPNGAGSLFSIVTIPIAAAMDKCK